MRHRAKRLITQLTIYVFNGLSVLGWGFDWSFDDAPPPPAHHHHQHPTPVVECVEIETMQKPESCVPEQKIHLSYLHIRRWKDNEEGGNKRPDADHSHFNRIQTALLQRQKNEILDEWGKKHNITLESKVHFSKSTAWCFCRQQQTCTRAGRLKARFDRPDLGRWFFGQTAGAAVPFSASHWGRRYKSFDFSGNTPPGATGMDAGLPLAISQCWVTHLPHSKITERDVSVTETSDIKEISGKHLFILLFNFLVLSREIFGAISPTNH